MTLVNKKRETKILAYISPKFIDFIKNSDALSMDLTVFKYGGEVHMWGRDDLPTKALPMVVDLTEYITSKEP